MNLTELIKKGASIIDVRTPMEFIMGNVKGSINIPLNEVPERLGELKTMNTPLILCCQSGARSGQACNYLTQNGIESHNGGPWFQVENAKSY